MNSEHAACDAVGRHLVELARALRDACDDCADVDIVGDPPRQRPNAWMRHVMAIDAALGEVARSVPRWLDPA